MKGTFFILSIVAISFLVACEGDEPEPVNCAGCPSDFPWSVPGAEDCYESFDDCDDSERGTCTVCI